MNAPQPVVPSIGPEMTRAARERLEGAAHRTPLITSRLLDSGTGGRVLLKAECLQRAGAFKFRGAYNAIAAQADESRRRGVITGSSGNHGGAVALAASLVGARAVVVMPKDASAVKLAAVRAYGAEIVQVGYTSAERLAYAADRAAREGLLEIPPYDHPLVIAGQSTATSEILEDAAPDVVLAPCGGGGLFAGACLAAEEHRARTGRRVEVWGVETEAANDTWRSFRENRRVRIEQPDTIADGMRTLEPGALTFPITRALAAGVVLVSDAQVRDAMRFLFTRLKLVAEPTGATSVAALLSGRLALGGRTAAAIVSGGNVDPAQLASLLA